MIPTRTDRGSAAGIVGADRSSSGRVPRRLIWDNEPGIGRGRRPRRGRRRVHRHVGNDARAAATLRPGVQGHGRAPQRLLRDLVHARPRRSASPADFNAQFTDWLQRRTPGWCARSRPARSICSTPTGRAMLPLPPVPLQLGWRNRVRLGRDYYVRLDTNDYSVDPAVIGRLVDVSADLDRVRVAPGRPPRRRPRPGLGPRHDHHRPGPCRRRRRCCASSSNDPRPAPGTDEPGPGPGRLRPRVRPQPTARSADGRPRPTDPTRAQADHTTSPPR